MTKDLANKTDHILYSVHDSSLILLLCKQYLQISHLSSLNHFDLLNLAICALKTSSLRGLCAIGFGVMRITRLLCSLALA